MYNFNYYDELKKASFIPDRIKKCLEQEEELKDVDYELFLRFIRVILYSTLHEQPLFEKIAETMSNAKKLPPFFKKRMNYDELFQCLCLLGKDCLQTLLSELDCSDLVFNSLQQTIRDKDYDGFTQIINNNNVNTVQITPVCRLVYVQIFLDQLFELFMKISGDLDSISDEQFEIESKKAVTIFKANIYSLINTLTGAENSPFITLANDAVDLGYESAISNMNCKDYLLRVFTKNSPEEVKNNLSWSDFRAVCYKLLLLGYYGALQESRMSPVTLEVLKEILIVPFFEPIWKQYEKNDALNLLEQDLEGLEKMFPLHPVLQEMPQISELNSQEPVVGSAFTWHLPPDFFDKNYIDKCEIDEYIPCFLEDKLKFATVTNDKLSELKVRLNDAFEEFIETLAENNCIDNDYVTKASLAHALTGRKVDVETKKVRWKNTQSTKRLGWLSNICHIVRYIYPKYIYDKEHNQLDKYGQMTIVFDLDFDSIPLEERPQRTPKSKLSSSYADNADDFIKDAIVKFINTVLVIKKSVCNME